MPEESVGEPSAEAVRRLIEAGLSEAEALRRTRAGMQPPADAIPGYVLEGEIGRGGMGVVYRAWQLSTKRIVAVKVMLGGLFASPATHRRFLREIELAARFQHPGIVRVLEGGHTTSGQPYYAMDYVQGVRLDRWLKTNQPETTAVLKTFREITAAVAHAHRQGVIHRDLKPANILVDEEGHPHILDFGLSKALDPSGSEDSLTLDLSSPGQVMGTMPYLAPEQASGNLSQVDARTDVYALGVVLYEALTGRLPFPPTRNPRDWLKQIQEQPPARPSSLSSRVDGDLEAILLKALEKEPANRYQTVEDFAADIERYMRGEPIRARRPSRLYRLRKRLGRHRRVAWAAMGVLVLGLLAIGGDLWRQRRALAIDRRELMVAQRYIESGRAAFMLDKIYAIAQRHPGLVEAHTAWYAARFRIAEEKRNDHEFGQTLEHLRVHTQEKPEWWPLQALLAEMYTRSGDPRAAEVQSRVKQHPPRSAEEWYRRSFATLDLNQAAERVLRAVTLDPEHVLAWERLGYLRLQLGDLVGADEAFARLIALEGEKLDWLLIRGHIRMRQRRFPEALSVYERAVRLYPEETAVYAARALAFLCLDRYEQAIADHSQVDRLTSGTNRWSIYKRATLLWMTGRLGRAADDLRRFLDYSEEVSYADLRLYLVLLDQAQHFAQAGQEAEAERARAEARDVLRAARRAVLPDSWLSRILACAAGEIAPERLVAAADPANREQVCEAYYYAGEIARLSGNLEPARNMFQRCVETDLMFDEQLYPLDPMNEYFLARWRLKQLAPTATRP